MIFNALHEAAQRGELLLVDGGMCHFHLRRDGVLTIREIIVLPDRQGQGIGRAMLDQLRAVPGARVIRAKCPAELASNHWYQAMGFTAAYVDQTKAGGRLYVWELAL
ncbi:MAG TPA: hypothetical protein DHV85_24785 [Candidatus Accumulibacter sp.]|nr:hypothetical protein [Accumulibacter sp.]